MLDNPLRPIDSESQAVHAVWRALGKFAGAVDPTLVDGQIGVGTVGHRGFAVLYAEIDGAVRRIFRQLSKVEVVFLRFRRERIALRWSDLCNVI